MMTNKTLNLNTSASRLIQGMSKVRVRTIDGALQIRPTNRVEGKNLPKGEILVDLRTKKQAVRGTYRFTIPGEMAGAVMMASGTTFRCIADKRGWVWLVGCDRNEVTARAIGDFAPSGGSVSER